MNRTIQFMIFFLIFFSIYSFMNYYVFNRISRIIDFRYLWFVFIILAVSLPLVSILERFFDGMILGVFYFISMSWLGTAFFLLISFAILDLIRLFIKFDYGKVGMIVLIAVAFIVLYSIADAQNTRIKKVELKMENLGQKELRIVQLSDIHVGTVHKAGFLRRIVDMANSQEPDIVVITGDLFDGSGPLTDDMLSPLNDFNAPAYFITGNHENYLGKEKAIRLVEDKNITYIGGKSIKTKGIQLIGVDYPFNEADRKTDKLNGFKLDKNMTKVVLYHQPVFQAGADLQLSGHTHNGQIFPFNALVRIAYKYISGLYEIDDRYHGGYLYTSNGIGTWGPPMRFLAPPEIVVVDLKRAKVY